MRPPERHAYITIPFHDLVAILSSKIVLPPDTRMVDATWSWEMQSLRVRISDSEGKAIPVSEEGMEIPSMMMSRNTVDTSPGLWWLEVHPL
jgi:hypothetical protein